MHLNFIKMSKNNNKETKKLITIINVSLRIAGMSISCVLEPS